MKKKINYLTTICFIVLLAGFCIFSIYPAGSAIKSFFIGLSLGQNVKTFHIENLFNEELPAKQFFVTLNGGFQRLMGVREVNEIAKLDNGYITYLIDECDVQQLAENTADFSEALEEKGIPFLYVNAPFKINMDNKMLPVGVADFSNENTDRFLEVLSERDVNFIDLRELMKHEGIDHYSSFFVTDHHWTPEAGMWACSRIAQRLADMDPSFEVDTDIYEASKYQFTEYENILLGSSGRRTGFLYAGRDDMTLITPKFDTSIRFFASRENLERTGSFEETIIFKEKLFSDNPYLAYCGGDYALLELENRSSEEDLEIQSVAKRILLIKDSFSEVVIPFLSLSYDNVLCIDMRGLQAYPMSFIEQFDPDAVVILYNGGAYSNNEVLFELLRRE